MQAYDNNVCDKAIRVQNSDIQESSVSVLDMANAREQKRLVQESLIKKYRESLICFSLNIPGPIKVGTLYKKVFLLGKTKIENALSENHFSVLYSLENDYFTGYEYYAVVASSALSINNLVDERLDFNLSTRIKEKMIQVEDETLLSRIFDIDVIDSTGKKITRTALNASMRKCFICEHNAYECARSRRHSTEELLARIEKIIREANIP
ncbi:MAG: citrate lyase holo-[Treponema sp.]|nr:citrate lyase holo-[acyl-carrier protein] synthase [Treponema sp.]